jgi:hypothetical protein
LRGDYAGPTGGQTQFGPIYYRYLIEKRTLTAISRPQKTAQNKG